MVSRQLVRENGGALLMEKVSRADCTAYAPNFSERMFLGRVII